MRRLPLVVLVLVCAYAAFVAWAFVFVGAGKPQRADAIIVLSGVRSRLPTGLRLYREGLAPTLVISRDPGPWREADSLCAHGAICFHAHPYSTQGEAEAFARLARAHGWHSVIVVSSRYHLRRAAMLFRRCSHVRVEVAAARTPWSNWLRNVPLETGKLLYQLTLDRDC